MFSWRVPLTSAAAAAVVIAAAGFLHRRRKALFKRVLVAVSGTIQDGFELRPNINYNGVEAIFVGWALVRGAKMYFDVKDVGCREFDEKVPHRVNPAMVLTGDAKDANQYALYLVDERAVVKALLGEPRLLSMAPDALRVELDDEMTSPEVAALARAQAARDGSAAAGEGGGVKSCAVTCVIAVYRSARFVAAPAVDVRSDGTRVTSFMGSLAKFAQISDVAAAPPSSAAWNAAVAKALAVSSRALEEAGGAGRVGGAAAPDGDSLYGTSTAHPCRLTKAMSASEFNALAKEAGISIRAL